MPAFNRQEKACIQSSRPSSLLTNVLHILKGLLDPAFALDVDQTPSLLIRPFSAHVHAPDCEWRKLRVRDDDGKSLYLLHLSPQNRKKLQAHAMVHREHRGSLSGKVRVLKANLSEGERIQGRSKAENACRSRSWFLEDIKNSQYIL